MFCQHLETSIGIDALSAWSAKRFHPVKSVAACMGEQVFHCAACLSDSIRQLNASFFDSNYDSPRSEWFTDGCKALAPMFVTMKFSSACMNYCDG
jgi:hypothetical protein